MNKQFTRSLQPISYEIETNNYIDDKIPEKDLQKQIVNNRYIFLYYISKGTFSESWVVYDINTFSYRNAKIYYNHHNNFSAFYNEKKIITIINHKNNDHLLVLFDIIEEDNRKMIITELLGLSLFDIINNINENEIDIYEFNIKYMFRQILRGIRELHDYNIIHCDIKPDNILTTIMPYYIENLISQIDKLDLQTVYNEFLVHLTPANFEDFNKSKKKNIKKKIKNKACSAIRDYIFTKIVFTNEDKNIYNVDFITSNNYNIKIIDFTNSENSSEITTEENYEQSYRSIEIILNNYNNQKADIWAVGCVFYELVTGQVLFDIPNYSNKLIQNIEHLHNIFTITEDSNKKDIIENSLLKEVYFTETNNLNYRITSVEPDIHMYKLKNLITENSKIECDINELYNFITLFFIYRQNMRPDSYTLLNHNYLS